MHASRIPRPSATRVAAPAAERAPAPHAAVLRPSTGGHPLPAPVQAKMEGALGHDFANVRVHSGEEAGSIGAVAFTRGSHIHFAPGRYNPHSAAGQRLLGHELAHVVQQRAGRVAMPGGPVPINADGRLESEADTAGVRAATGLPSAVAGAGAAVVGDGAIQPCGGLFGWLFGRCSRRGNQASAEHDHEAPAPGPEPLAGPEGDIDGPPREAALATDGTALADTARARARQRKRHHQKQIRRERAAQLQGSEQRPADKQLLAEARTAPLPPDPVPAMPVAAPPRRGPVPSTPIAATAPPKKGEQSIGGKKDVKPAAGTVQPPAMADGMLFAASSPGPRAAARSPSPEAASRMPSPEAAARSPSPEAASRMEPRVPFAAIPPRGLVEWRMLGTAGPTPDAVSSSNGDPLPSRVELARRAIDYFHETENLLAAKRDASSRAQPNVGLSLTKHGSQFREHRTVNGGVPQTKKLTDEDARYKKGGTHQFVMKNKRYGDASFKIPGGVGIPGPSSAESAGRAITPDLAVDDRARSLADERSIHVDVSHGEACTSCKHIRHLFLQDHPNTASEEIYFKKIGGTQNEVTERNNDSEVHTAAAAAAFLSSKGVVRPPARPLELSPLDLDRPLPKYAEAWPAEHEKRRLHSPGGSRYTHVYLHYDPPLKPGGPLAPAVRGTPLAGLPDLPQSATWGRKPAGVGPASHLAGAGLGTGPSAFTAVPTLAATRAASASTATGSRAASEDREERKGDRVASNLSDGESSDDEMQQAMSASLRTPRSAASAPTAARSRAAISAASASTATGSRAASEDLEEHQQDSAAFAGRDGEGSDDEMQQAVRASLSTSQGAASARRATGSRAASASTPKRDDEW